MNCRCLAYLKQVQGANVSDNNLNLKGPLVCLEFDVEGRGEG